MQLPTEILAILDRLDHAGYASYVVGGAVRDSLMGITPSDFDVATPALPDQVKELFADHKIIETGIQHGTVTLLWDRLPVEITTFRVESAYSDFRHPDEVRFSRNIRDDLSRRDFTVNAICYSPETGYYDPFGGMADIDRRVLRTVGKAACRFKEDALRILRALRFSAVLGFAIDPDTAAAAFEQRGLLSNISAERIMTELKKLLIGPAAAKVLNHYFPIVAAAVSPLSDYAAREVDFTPLQGCVTKETATRFSAFLLCAVADAKQAAALAEPVLRFLKSDNRLRREVCLLLEHFLNPPPSDEVGVKRMLYHLSAAQTEEVFALWQAFGICDSDRLCTLRQMLGRITAEHQCCRLSDLAVTGDDLLAAGIKPQQIGSALQFLLSAVIEQCCENETKQLLCFLRHWETK